VTGSGVVQSAIARETLEVRGSWTIFDGFATKGAKLEAKADQRLWERNRQIAADAALDDAQHLQRLVALDARAMEIAETRRIGADALVQRETGELKLGRGSSSAVDAATRGLRFAETASATARANFLSDWSALVSLVSDDPVLNNLPNRYVRVKH
jgi:hypothetical protein